jgi:hypothetical protein
MDEIIRQIRAASEAGLYFMALFGALVLPDMCAALASDNGSTSGPKYRAWLKTYVPEEAADADLIWGVRCSLLHQGRAMPHGGAFPMAFTILKHGEAGLHIFPRSCQTATKWAGAVFHISLRMLRRAESVGFVSTAKRTQSRGTCKSSFGCGPKVSLPMLSAGQSSPDAGNPR